MEKITRIADLLVKHLRNELTREEQETLDQWVSASPLNEEMFEQVMNERMLAEELQRYKEINTEAVASKIKMLMQQEGFTFTEEKQIIPVHRVYFLRTAWFRYAAAIILLFGIGSYLYMNNQKEKPSVTQTSPLPMQNDVAPGGNRATLTLADGSVINLDSAANGTLARDGSVTIIKKGDGQIIYSLQTKPPALAGGDGSSSGSAVSISYNTVSTPRGGQYQLVLPDGSQVWLNAESSIRYPTVFAGNERKVTITGEAYFEVTHNAKKPFRVEAESQTIEVLGTHFNVNTYSNETTLNTTLLEGSVRIKTLHTSLTLKPGQQGQLNSSTNSLSLAVNPDVELVMAWKNGYFNFKGADLKTVMRQVERWYDVEVVYETHPGEMKFSGEIQRNLNLSDLLEGLRKTHIHFRIQGRQLIITR
jgi:transmembrane sensor